MKRNNKGQTIVTYLFTLVAFMFVWFAFLGKWLSIVGEQAITTTGATGIEAFTYANLNFIVLIAVLITLVGLGIFSGASS